MTESDFGAALEYRVSRELSELSDKRLRFLWCYDKRIDMRPYGATRV